MIGNVSLPASAQSLLDPSSGADEVTRMERIASRSASGEELSEKEIREVGQQFESILLHQLMKSMRRTIPESSLFENSHAKQIYEDMFDEKITKQIAQTSQSGIADAIVEEIIRQQQSQKPPTGDQTRFLPLDPGEAKWGSLDRGVDYRPIERDQVRYFPLPTDSAELKPIPGRQRN